MSPTEAAALEPLDPTAQAVLPRLTLDDVVHVEEVAAPEGVEIPFDVNFTVLTVKGHKAEEEELEEGEEAEAEGEEAAAE